PWHSPPPDSPPDHSALCPLHALGGAWLAAGHLSSAPSLHRATRPWSPPPAGSLPGGATSLPTGGVALPNGRAVLWATDRGCFSMASCCLIDQRVLLPLGALNARPPRWPASPPAASRSLR